LYRSLFAAVGVLPGISRGGRLWPDQGHSDDDYELGAMR
jgi:hypothetical protein